MIPLHQDVPRMKAVVYEKYGPPEVLHVKAVGKPVPKANEILIRVCAAEATKGDCEMRSFQFPVKWFLLPMRLLLGIRQPRNPVLGMYFAGEVESVGPAVAKFQPGDRLFGSTQLKLGAYGEYICLPERCTMTAMPHNLSFAESAAVPLGGLNALHFMRKARLQPGETVLVNGAGGSIGIYAVQIAKMLGAEVTAVDAAHKEEMLRGIGADHFIDYTKTDYTKNGRTYDVIFNMVARNSYAGSIRSLKPKGRYLIGNPRLSDLFRSVLTSLTTDKSVTIAFAQEKVEELIALKEMIEAGKIRSIIDKVYPMEQAAAAHRRVESEQRIGMIVISGEQEGSGRA